MTCPKCGSDNIYVRDVRYDDDNNTFRKRKCVNCDHIFFTRESVIEKTHNFMRHWRENDRRRKENRYD